MVTPQGYWYGGIKVLISPHHLTVVILDRSLASTVAIRSGPTYLFRSFLITPFSPDHVLASLHNTKSPTWYSVATLRSLSKSSFYARLTLVRFSAAFSWQASTACSLSWEDAHYFHYIWFLSTTWQIRHNTTTMWEHKLCWGESSARIHAVIISTHNLTQFLIQPWFTVSAGPNSTDYGTILSQPDRSP